MAEKNPPTVFLDDQTKCFQIAGVMDQSEGREFKTKIISLGGEFLLPHTNAYNPNCTHLLAKTFKPTEKILCCLAARRWILSFDYLLDSYKNGYWMNEEDYEFKDSDNIVSYCRKRPQPPYHNWKVHVTLSDRIRQLSFASTLKAGGATIISRDDIVYKRSLPQFVFSDNSSCRGVRQLVSENIPIIDIMYIRMTLLMKQDVNCWNKYLIHKKYAATKQHIPVLDLTADGAATSLSPIKRKKTQEIIDISNCDKTIELSSESRLSNSVRKTRANIRRIKTEPQALDSTFNLSKGITSNAGNKRSYIEVDLTNSSFDNLLQKTSKKRAKEIPECISLEDITDDSDDIKILSSVDNTKPSVSNKYVPKKVSTRQIDKTNILQNVSNIDKGNNATNDNIICIDETIDDVTTKITPSLILPKKSSSTNPAKVIIESARKNIVNDISLKFIRKSRRHDRSMFASVGGGMVCDTNLIKDAKEIQLSDTNMFASLRQKEDDCDDENLNFSDETEWLYMASIDWLFCFLSPMMYPRAEHVGIMLERFIGQGNWHNAELKATSMIHILLELHPPATSEMRLYYLRVLSNACPVDIHENKPWKYIDSKIEAAVKVCTSDDADWELVTSCCRPLEFVIGVIKNDLAHWDESRKSVSDLFTYQLFWKQTTNLLILTKVQKDLVKWFVESTKVHFRVRRHITQLFEAMLEIMWISNAKINCLSPALCCPPPFMQQLSYELCFQLKTLDINDHLSLIYNISSPKNNLYILCVMYHIMDTQRKNLDLKMAGEFLKIVVGICGEKKVSKTPVLMGDSTLLEKLNKRNAIGETSLFRACERNNIERVKKLLLYPGIDINIPNQHMVTPLHKAVIMGHEEIVNILLRYEPPPQSCNYDSLVDLTTAGKRNNTPLHDAVTKSRFTIAESLLKFGGETLLHKKNEDGKLPFDSSRTKRMTALLSTFKGEGELKRKAYKLQLQAFKGRHHELIEYMGYFFMWYLNSMGVRYIRQKLRMNRTHVLKQKLASGDLAIEDSDQNCSKIFAKEKNTDSNIISAGSMFIEPVMKDKCNFFMAMNSTIIQTDRTPTDLKESYSYILNDLISCRRIVENFEENFSKKCSHTKFLQLALFS